MDTKVARRLIEERRSWRDAYDLNQATMIPLIYADQVVEGSFERALNEIVEEHLDMSAFDKRYSNDETGRVRPAYDPRILLQVVLYGYYKGIISSRALAEACRRKLDREIALY